MDARVDLRTHLHRLQGMKSVLESASLTSAKGSLQLNFLQSEIIKLELKYKSTGGVSFAGAGFNIKTIEGIRVGGFNTYMSSPPPHSIPSHGLIRFVIPARQFTPGMYVLTVSIGSPSRPTGRSGRRLFGIYYFAVRHIRNWLPINKRRWCNVFNCRCRNSTCIA